LTVVILNISQKLKGKNNKFVLESCLLGLAS